MSFPPSEAPLPADSPVANTSSPLRPPLTGLAPLVSPPLAPPSVVVLPPESSVVPVASPPLPPESNTLLPPVLPPDVAPPPEPPQVTTPLPHETPPSPPLVKAPPPEAPLIAPGNDPLPPGPPTQPVISPSIPSPMAPKTPPLPPLPPLNPTIPRPSPVFSQPPSETIPQPPPEVPLTPEVSPLPLTSPLAPKTSPFAPETPSTTLSPATRHGVPYTPPISLPLANGNLPVSSKHSDVSAGLILGFVIGGLFLLLVIAIVLLCCKFRRRKNDATPSLYPKDNPKGQLSEQNGSAPGAHAVNIQDSIFLQPPLIRSRCSPVMDPWSRNISPVPPPAPYRALGLSSVIFSYDELMVATNGFSEANLIGQGGFGYVHKGVLPSGKEIAVKKLKAGSSQGDSEFQAELEIIGRVHHKHLVSLEGYCITSSERLLVYEFVPNNTLEFHLHGNGQPVMQWASRLKIATGSARGLAYLHEDCNPTIIHRDIKAANILLNHNFEAKVSDFGLAKSFSGAITHITTRVVGTFGYLAPEYASSGKLTDKSDIYSFGVVLLELITGRPPISDSETDMRNGLVDWARPLLNQVLEEGDFRPLVDPRLESNYNVSEMTTMVACATACVRHSAWLRPRMSQIVRALEGDISANDLSEGIRSMYDSSGSSTYDAYQHRDEMKDFNMVMASWQQGISGTTSEYGLKLSGSSSEESGRYCAKDRK